MIACLNCSIPWNQPTVDLLKSDGNDIFSHILSAIINLEKTKKEKKIWTMLTKMKYWKQSTIISEMESIDLT